MKWKIHYIFKNCVTNGSYSYKNKKEESYLLKHVLPYVSIALENCYTLNPDDPLDFICRYLTEKGKQIEKEKAEERTRKYNRQLFESNQLESAKVHLSIMLSQLNEKFVRSEEGSSNEVNESKDHKK